MVFANKGKNQPMKNTIPAIKISLITTGLFLFTSVTQAQINLNRIKDKAKNTVNNKKENSSSGKTTVSEADKYSCKNTVEDNGSSGPVHTKYQKKIVFSKNEIVKGQENETSFSNTFTLADNIYSRIYIEKSLGNESKNIGLCSDVPVNIRFTIDDGQTTLPQDAGKAEVKASQDYELTGKWTTWQLGMSPSSTTGYPYSEIQNFYDKMAYLPEGNHKIKIELVLDVPDDYVVEGNEADSYLYTTKFGPEKVLSSGEFTINIKNADKVAMKKKLGTLSKTEKAAANESQWVSSSGSSSSSSSGGSSSVSVNIVNKCGSSVYAIIETPGGSSAKESFSGNTSSYKSMLGAGTKIKNASGALIYEITGSTPSGYEVIICK